MKRDKADYYRQKQKINKLNERVDGRPRRRPHQVRHSNQPTRVEGHKQVISHLKLILIATVMEKLAEIATDDVMGMVTVVTETGTMAGEMRTCY